MNKRIKEFIDQATEEIPHEREWNATSYIFNKEKFAELIVRECASLADDLGVQFAGYYDKDGRDIAYSIRDTIKEHFGVKE